MIGARGDSLNILSRLGSKSTAGKRKNEEEQKEEKREKKQKNAESDAFSSGGIFAALDKQINSDVDQGFPGGIIRIFRQNGEMLGEKIFGYRLRYDKEGKELPPAQQQLMTIDTRFDIASITKIFGTVFALMHLTHEKKLDIDRPVHFYWPEYTGNAGGDPPQSRDERLVKDLLSHAAGYEASPKFYDEKLVGPELYSQEREKTMKSLLKLPFQRSRDEKPLYDDPSFMLLGFLIEKITGKPLNKYLQDEIYGPLGLENTGFNPSKKERNLCAATELAGNTRGGSVSFNNVRTETVQGEVQDENAYYSMKGISGHAGLFTTVDEATILLQVLANGGHYGDKIFWTPEIQEKFLVPHSKDPTFSEGGFRVGEYPMFGKYASSKTFGHTGFTGILISRDPENDISILYLTNAAHTMYEYKDKVKKEGGIFVGKNYVSGKYGEICNLVYEALKIPKATPEKSESKPSSVQCRVD